ncbi:hypothetical protein [Nocardia sp. BSTN01]|uniref:hypothetical protein n=1 Tax=Nocardia sp. BSTN01 TaxID=2783665 RepID=UPI001E2A0C5F|nr:hypothetical protein [Nocardia sp. BSTN01]
MFRSPRRSAALAIVGYFAGANWQHVEDVLRGPSYAVAAVVGLAIVTAAVLYLRRRSRRQAGSVRAVDAQPGKAAR